MRLTNQIRNVVIEELLDVIFPKSKIDNLEQDCAEELEKYLLAQLPNGWEKYSALMRKCKSVYVTTPEHGSRYFKLKNKIPSTGIRYGDIHLHINEIEKSKAPALIRRYIGAEIRRENERKRLEKVVYAVSSDSRLFELLPAAKEIINIEKQDTSLVPIDELSKLNDAISNRLKK